MNKKPVVIQCDVAMELFNLLEEFKKKYHEHGVKVPQVHFVLGSGVGAAFEEAELPATWKRHGKVSFSSFKNLCGTTVQGHSGAFHFLEYTPKKQFVTLQAGRLHGYEGHNPREVVLPVMATRLLGTEKFVLTNAAGGLRREFSSGSVMMITDHVNLTGTNPLVGDNPVWPHGKPIGPRFPDMSSVYDIDMRQRLHGALMAEGIEVNEGVYLGLLGPTFETPAEVRLFASWGMDAVGMSTVWEAIALHHAGARVAGLSLISNLACGLVEGQILDHEEILQTSMKASKKVIDSLLAFAAEELTHDS